MTRITRLLIVVVALAAQAALAGRAQDASGILAEVRRALGGEKLGEVQSIAVEGRAARPGQNGTIERQFEMNLKLPDKFMRREVLAAMGNMSVYRIAGFNGSDGLINEIDQPPQLGHGGIRVFAAGSAMGSAEELTPEEKEQQRQSLLLETKQDYARLALGIFAAAPAVYPLEFAYAGQAESPDGTADVIDVTGEGGFAARLFVDTNTHLPLMLSWMAKEPLSVSMGGPGGRAAGMPGVGGGGGGAMVMRGGGGGGGAVGGGRSMSAEEREQLRTELEARMKEAEANRRVVEYRLFYGDYQTVGGVKIPHRVQRMIDGTVAEELTFDRVRVNQKIDDKKFQVSK